MVLQLLRDDYRRHGSRITDPALIALYVYRLGHWAFYLKPGLLRWLMLKVYGLINLFVANITKVWIAPKTMIGKDFHLIHAEGSVSIHQDAVIGDRCGVMHNVTIGTNMVEGAPTIGDDVFIGVNSVVLGPIKIGDRVRIGACTAVVTNVPADSIVVGSPARIYPRLMPFAGGPKRKASPEPQASSSSESRVQL
jgi:serine O-acetyltransferase